MAEDALEKELEARVEALGYELVELERAGSKSRPILRLRIDRPDAVAGAGVTVDDCSRVSRALEPFLDEQETISERYVLEVSSPGIERPLVKARDFERFAGQEVAIVGRAPLAGRGRRLEGQLIGLDPAQGAERVRVRLEEGEVVDIPRAEIARAHLIFRWQDRS
jgi:ribosome maturation factor RimP